MIAPCRHCTRPMRIEARGLCQTCYNRPAVRGLYPLSARPRKGPPTPVCRHCKNRKANKARGLCWPCYYRPGVRGRYDPLSYCGIHTTDVNGGYALPPRTAALPGTPEKIAVLTARVERTLSLFHPEDAKWQLS